MRDHISLKTDHICVWAGPKFMTAANEIVTKVIKN